jgi:hypothetical protein
MEMAGGDGDDILRWRRPGDRMQVCRHSMARLNGASVQPNAGVQVGLHDGEGPEQGKQGTEGRWSEL